MRRRPCLVERGVWEGVRSWIEIWALRILSSLRTQTGPWSDTFSYFNVPRRLDLFYVSIRLDRAAWQEPEDHAVEGENVVVERERPWLGESQVLLKSKLTIKWKLGSCWKGEPGGQQRWDGATGPIFRAICGGENINNCVFTRTKYSWLELSCEKLNHRLLMVITLATTKRRIGNCWVRWADLMQQNVWSMCLAS